jgi:hypothetical protein
VRRASTQAGDQPPLSSRRDRGYSPRAIIWSVREVNLAAMDVLDAAGPAILEGNDALGHRSAIDLSRLYVHREGYPERLHRGPSEGLQGPKKVHAMSLPLSFSRRGIHPE